MRHHHDAARRTPSINLGASGPVRVTSEDADPDFVPPPFLGFTHIVWSRRSTGEVLAVAELGDPQVYGDRDPSLWQDEGDQA